MPRVDVMPDRFDFAFASCQHYETGFYTAYQHLCAESPDLILHLGDYIYEGGRAKNKRPRHHHGKEIMTLEDYRVRYAQYKSDRDLQAAHAVAPWLVTWDDHEVDNNYANLISEKEGISEQEFGLRRAAAYQAYYENMPLRSSSLPAGVNMLLYRRCHFGQLAQIDMLDTRQYRTDQPNGDGMKALTGDVYSPDATMLGQTQEKWLLDGLQASNSKWDILGQQVVATELIGTSISSGGNGTAKPEYVDALLAENPFVKFHNAERGYVRCTVTPKEWVTEYQTVPFVDRTSAPKMTRAKFHIFPDRPGLHT